MLNNKRTVIVCVAAFAGIALSLFGCGDDDKKVDSGAIADSICKSMVQCEGKLGKLPGTLTAADVQNKIDTCNNLIVAKFFNNAKSDSEAADYIKCLEGLDCNTLDSVYTSQGDTVPQACQSQHQAYTNKGGNGGNSGNGSVITCDPNNEVCACFNDSCNPRWITDNSCICQGGSSNQPTGQCADDDIACWCKKSPNLPACQGSSNPPADQCADNDVECICKKNPNLPACQGSSNPPADQCSDDDVECICKKNPNLPACQETPPPADQCSDDDLACQCKKNPNLPACQETPPPADQCSDDDVECICKKNPNLPACQSSTPVFECKDDKDLSLSCMCKTYPDLACRTDNPPQYDLSKLSNGACNNDYQEYYKKHPEKPISTYNACLSNEQHQLGYRYCADRVGTDTHCGIQYSSEYECRVRVGITLVDEPKDSDCYKKSGKGKFWHELCDEALVQYMKCMTSVPCSELQKGADNYENCMKTADPKKEDRADVNGKCDDEKCMPSCYGCDICYCGETIACEKKKNPCKLEEDLVRQDCSHCPSMGWK